MISLERSLFEYNHPDDTQRYRRMEPAARESFSVAEEFFKQPFATMLPRMKTSPVFHRPKALAQESRQQPSWHQQARRKPPSRLEIRFLLKR